ncbi:hypothetical protein ANTPLA_LOCUS5905 [Anthophora plagiata]
MVEEIERTLQQLYPATQGREAELYQRSTFLVAIHKRPPIAHPMNPVTLIPARNSVGDETISVFSVHSLPLNANAS